MLRSRMVGTTWQQIFTFLWLQLSGDMTNNRYLSSMLSFHPRTSFNHTAMKQFGLFFFLLISFSLFGQQADRPFPTTNASPPGKITQAIGNTQIQVEYERPLVRKRKIFGDLVPWDKIGRA